MIIWGDMTIIGFEWHGTDWFQFRSKRWYLFIVLLNQVRAAVLIATIGQRHIMIEKLIDRSTPLTQSSICVCVTRCVTTHQRFAWAFFHFIAWIFSNNKNVYFQNFPHPESSSLHVVQNVHFHYVQK